MIALRAPRKSEPCAGTNTIAALLAGARDPGLERHLDACDTCRRLVADLGRGLSRIGATPTRALPVVGERLGRYEIARVIGAGGMGVVYEARDALLERTVALKLMRPDLIDAAALPEAKAMARIQHPNVAVVHDAGVIAGQPFVCMEYIAGSTLRAWLREPRALRDVLATFLAAGRGLAYVHDAGMVHLDFKPDNVLIGRGRVVVSDFGLARAAGHRGVVIGTPAYMAPEQRRGARTDARADQYAFCLALREAVGARTPTWLRRVLARGLADRPADRFTGMGELLAAIEAGMRRRRWPAVVIVAAATACIAALELPSQVVDRPVVQRVVEHVPGAIVYEVEPAAGVVDDPPVAIAPAVVGVAPARAAHTDVTADIRANAPGDLAEWPTPAPTLVRAPKLETVSAVSTAGAASSSIAGDCDDSPRTCTADPPACPPTTILAVQNGCWTCADDRTCAPLGIPHSCDDASHLTCASARPECPGHEVASVHAGCWLCTDPFTCGNHGGATPPPHGSGSGSGGGSGSGSGSGGSGQSWGWGSGSGDGSGSGASGSGSGGGGSGGGGSGAGSSAWCGNGFCEIGEDHASCPSDCT
jgi:predicted Ser/Thr protein kinase